MASAAESSVHQQSCVYCLKIFSEMIDARELPCQHITCLSCIQSDRQLSEKGCRNCGKPVDRKPIASFPQLTLETDEVYKEHGCDSCTEPAASPAVSFCTQCDTRMCAVHEQNHRALFQERHKVIAIATYAEKPKYYSKPICTHHPLNIIILACSKCHEVMCASCPSKTCADGSNHEFQPVGSVAEELIANMERLMKQCSDKITAFAKMEKEACQFAETVAEKCEAMIEQVTKTAEEQIAEIKQNADKLKQQIVDYEEKRLAEISQFISDLGVKVENLQRLQTSTTLFVKSSHPTEIVKTSDEMSGQLQSAIEENPPTEYNSLDKERQLDHQENFKLQWPLCFTSCPQFLHYVRDFDCERENYCRTVNFTSEGDLLIGCCGDALLFDMKNYSEKYSEHISDFDDIRTAIEVIDNGLPHLLVMCDSRAVYKLDSRLQNMRYLTVIDKAFSNGASGLSVLKDMLILTNCGCDISIISMSGGSRKDYNIPNTTCIHSICSHKNGHIVTLDSIKGQVSMYQVLNTTEPRLVWSRKISCEAYAICTDQKTGRIFVTGRGKKLLIISPDGQMIKSLGCTELPSFDDVAPGSEFSDICIHGDTLVATRYRSKTLSVFKLIYE